MRTTTVSATPREDAGRDEALVLVVLLLTAFVLRIGAWGLLPNTHHPDEIFQTLEPAHRLLAGTGVVTWEWRDGIRSWMFPGFLAGIMSAAELLQPTAGMRLFGVAAVLSGLSLAVVVVGFLVGRRARGLDGALVVGGVAAVWPDLIYFAPKALTEVVAAHLMVIAAYLAWIAEDRPRSASFFFGLGALLGLTFCLRFHLAFALLAIAIWACRAHWKFRWIPLTLSAAVPVLASGILDLLTWGTPFQSVWKNFWINVVQGRSLGYGTAPAHWYFLGLADLWGAAVVPVLLLFVAGASRGKLFAIVAGVVWLSHIPLGHKEMRFIYPATPLIVIVAGLGIVRLLEFVRFPAGTTKLGAAAACVVWWGLMGLMVAVEDDFWDLWLQGRDMHLAQAHARADPALCGFAFVGQVWGQSGGYSHVGRPVPVYYLPLPDQPEFPPDATLSFNVAVTATETPIAQSYRIDRCWGKVCVQKREGACTKSSAPDPNTLFQLKGW